MAGLTGADAATLLLGLLPKEAAERVLACLDPKDAEQFRAASARHLASPSPELQVRVLNAFFEIQRLDAKSKLPAQSPGGRANVPSAAHGGSSQANNGPATADGLPALRVLDPALLTRALEGEMPATIAVVLSQLQPECASAVLKNQPPAQRSGLAVRMNMLTNLDQELVNRLALAVMDKAGQLAEKPPEPSADERVRNLAAMLRRLDRDERKEVIRAIEQADPQAAPRIEKAMFQFDDFLLVEDRPLQNLLAELDMTTLASAIKGASDQVSEKIFRNISSRTRQLLTDEIGLLGSISKAAIQEAQDKMVQLLRQFEEEGKIILLA